MADALLCEEVCAEQHKSAVRVFSSKTDDSTAARYRETVNILALELRSN